MGEGVRVDGIRGSTALFPAMAVHCVLPAAAQVLSAIAVEQVAAVVAELSLADCLMVARKGAEQIDCSLLGSLWDEKCFDRTTADRPLKALRNCRT